MVLVEAAMLGRPMVSCEIGTGTSYVNLEGESGFVIPPEEPQALADSLCALLSEPGLATKLGQGARARYERMFSGPALGLAYSNLYQDVVRA
jgi:rhamnosyl/mannosyltransferase